MDTKHNKLRILSIIYFLKMFTSFEKNQDLQIKNAPSGRQSAATRGTVVPLEPYRNFHSWWCAVARVVSSVF
jgi:hypothetical protein